MKRALLLRPKAIIFDMDGVILDSREAHYQAFAETFAELDITFSRNDFMRLYGTGARNVFATVFEERKNKSDVDYYIRKKDKLYRELFSAKVVPVPGVIEFMKKAKAFRKCIASSTSRENIEYALKHLDIRGLVEFHIAREDVEKTKPSPDAYNQAIKKLRLKPGECLVIEDTLVGIAAAKGSGAVVAAITTTLPREKLGSADLVFDTYDELKGMLGIPQGSLRK